MENFPEVITDVNLFFPVEQKKPRYRYNIVKLQNGKEKKIPKEAREREKIIHKNTTFLKNESDIKHFQINKNRVYHQETTIKITSKGVLQEEGKDHRMMVSDMRRYGK